MPRRPPTIDLTKDLPLRPRLLSAEALSDVFGGCVPLWSPCTSNGDCCQDDPTIPKGRYALCRAFRDYSNGPVLHSCQWW